MKNRLQDFLIISFVLIFIIVITYQLLFLSSGIGKYTIQCQRSFETNEVTCSQSETSHWGMIRAEEKTFPDIKSAKVSINKRWIRSSIHTERWLTVDSAGREVDFIGLPPSFLPFSKGNRINMGRTSQASNELGLASQRINDFIESSEESLSFTILKDSFYTLTIASIYIIFMVPYLIFRARKGGGRRTKS